MFETFLMGVANVRDVICCLYVSYQTMMLCEWAG